MTERRDPWKCPDCETVNAWNAERCRTCGGVVTESAAQESAFESNDRGASVEETAAAGVSPSEIPDGRASAFFGRRRWNIFWIALGIGLHVISIQVGVFGIMKYLIEPDPELKETLERAIETAGKEQGAENLDIADGLSEGAKSRLSTIRLMVIALVLFVPLAIGGVIGFFTANALEGAASMGLSAVLIPLLNNAAIYAVLWGPVNAGLGALGAFLGLRLRLKTGKA